MVVFGRTKEERTGNILFHGNLEQCREYAGALERSNYDSLDICEDGGIIKEFIVLNGLPVPEHEKHPRNA